MTRVIQRFAQRRNIARHARRGFVVDCHDRANLVLAVRLQAFGESDGIGAAMPVAGNQFGGETEAAGYLRPLESELSVVECDDLIARTERIHERGFPGAGGRARENRDIARGFENRFHAVYACLGQRDCVRTAVVDGGICDGVQNPVGDVGGSGELKKMTAWLKGH